MIEEVLHSLGITSNYVGYKQAVLALQLALDDESRLYAANRRIYRVVAEELSCSAYSVERNFRTIIDRAWKFDKQRVIQMAGFEMVVSPSVVRFLSILVVYIQRKLGLSYELASARACRSIRQNERDDLQ